MPEKAFQRSTTKLFGKFHFLRMLLLIQGQDVVVGGALVETPNFGFGWESPLQRVQGMTKWKRGLFRNIT
jgi:hypothetical protein